MDRLAIFSSMPLAVENLREFGILAQQRGFLLLLAPSHGQAESTKERSQKCDCHAENHEQGEAALERHTKYSKKPIFRFKCG